jgi:hypothetical protein
MHNALKHLFTFAFALVFMAGMAFAQTPGDNTATTTQVGDDHRSTITQTLGFSSAEPHVAQVIQRAGDNNFSDIQQGQAKGRAFVEQIGSDNVSRLSQAGFNRAEVTMNGDGNRLGRYENLSSPARQENGTGNGSIRQNFLSLDVVGNNNQTGVFQDAGNRAEITVRTGNRNRINVSQDREGLGVYTGPKNRAFVDVNGNRNNINIFQGAGVGANLADVDIVNGGSDNLVDIDQLSDGNTAEAFINGLNNQSVIKQQY